MSLTINQQVLEASNCEALSHLRRTRLSSRDDREMELDVAKLTNDDLADVLQAAKASEDRKTVRALEAILKARAGKFDTLVPNFKAFEAMLRAFLAADLLDGWLYVRGPDGKLYPGLVTEVTYKDGRGSYRDKPEPKVTVRTVAYGMKDAQRDVDKMGVTVWDHTFGPSDVVNKRVADVLAAADIFKETAELKADYVASMARHNAVTAKGFAKQFRFSGIAYMHEDDDYRRRGLSYANRKVVHDLEPSDYAAFRNYSESVLFEDTTGSGEVPEHPMVRIFDLKAHEFLWVHGDWLEPYQYDLSLRDKLVLPKSHRDLLDVLTSDLDAFTADIIEGKSAGNIILCTGKPGLGKTLTAEVYAELTGAPLYSVHSGTLGTTASDIEQNLKVVIARAKRWSAVALLDEADVFVLARGSNIEQNAIVAEFLRVLEYMDQLMFMTTNRKDEIDDAIISRAAAIIAYDVPGREDTAAVWRVMSTQFEAQLADEVIVELLDLFPTIAPRDIKMLLRLALRVAKKNGDALNLELFRRCAMFRAIEMVTPHQP